MRTPEIQIKRKYVIYGSEDAQRMIFEQESGKAIFVAEYLRKDGVLNCSWLCDKSIDEFKAIVKPLDGKVKWISDDEYYWGESRECNYFYDLMPRGFIPRSGVQAKINDSSDLEIGTILGRIGEIASKSIAEKAKLPQNLLEKVNGFVFSVR